MNASSPNLSQIGWPRRESAVALLLCTLLPAWAALAAEPDAGILTDLALVRFIQSEPEVVTAFTTPESRQLDHTVVAFDVNGDGLLEIFVSREDLLRDNLWKLYRQSGDNVLDLGVVSFNARIRPAERDGVLGYYELSRGSAGTVPARFVTIDSDGDPVAVWQGHIEPEGADKDFYDSLWGANAAPGPEISVVRHEEIVSRALRMERDYAPGRGMLRAGGGQASSFGAEPGNYPPEGAKSPRGEGEQGGASKWKGWLILLFGVVCVLAVILRQAKPLIRRQRPDPSAAAG